MGSNWGVNSMILLPLKAGVLYHGFFIINRQRRGDCEPMYTGRRSGEMNVSL